MMSKATAVLSLLLASSVVSAAPQKPAVLPRIPQFNLKIAGSSDRKLNGKYINPEAMSEEQQTRVSHISRRKPKFQNAGPMSIVSNGKLVFNSIDATKNIDDITDSLTGYSGGFATSGDDNTLYFAKDTNFFSSNPKAEAEVSDFVTIGAQFALTKDRYLTYNGEDNWTVCSVNIEDSNEMVDVLTHGDDGAELCRKVRLYAEATW